MKFRITASRSICLVWSYVIYMYHQVTVYRLSMYSSCPVFCSTWLYSVLYVFYGTLAQVQGSPCDWLDALLPSQQVPTACRFCT